MPNKALIVGATSAIAQETAKLMAGDGDRLYLVGRSAEKLRGVAGDLRVRTGTEIDHVAVDLDDLERHEEIVERAAASLGGLDTVIVAHGVLGDQQVCERDFAKAERVFHTNFLSAASILNVVGKRFADQRGGTIVGISSVAGDRGRRSNYVYGASKGALSLFLQGLRNRLHSHGVVVITVKPGFVDTPMTAHLERGLLFADPATVARGIHRAIRRGKSVVYLPWFWRPIMLVVRHIPEFVFKRLKL